MLNLNCGKSFEFVRRMRCELVNFIGVCSGSIGCNKVGYRVVVYFVCLNI